MMETIPQTLALSGEVTNSKDATVPVSDDMRPWVHIAHVAHMPYLLTEQLDKISPLSNSGRTARALIIGPMVNVGEETGAGLVFNARSYESWQHLIIEFDEQNTWVDTFVFPKDSSVWFPQQEEGFTAVEAAYIYGIQLETSRGLKSWRSWRKQDSSLTIEQAENRTKEILKTFTLLKGYETVKLSALTMLRNAHQEEYEELLEVAQVEKALRSGWHIPANYM